MATREDLAKAWLEEVLSQMGYPAHVRTIEPPYVQDAESQAHLNYWLDIQTDRLTSDQVAWLLGKDGETLDALQYLANVTLNAAIASEAEHYFYTLELNGYRQSRIAELVAMAETAAQSVRATGQEYRLEHLSPAERRQIHMFLKAVPDVETVSQGKEPYRYLVVRPASPLVPH